MPVMGHGAGGIAHPFRGFRGSIWLPRQVDDEGALRITATCRERIAVGTKLRLIRRFAETRHQLVRHGQGGFRRNVPPGRAGAAGGQDQMAARPSTSSFKVASMVGCSSGMTGLRPPGRGQGAAQPFLQGGMP